MNIEYRTSSNTVILLQYQYIDQPYAGSLKEIREVAEKHPSLKEVATDLITSVKIRLTQHFS